MAKNIAKDKELTTKVDEKDKEFADPTLPIEGTKEPDSPREEAPKAPAREMVRGEDVLKIMRAKGVKI